MRPSAMRHLGAVLTHYSPPSLGPMLSSLPVENHSAAAPPQNSAALQATFSKRKYSIIARTFLTPEKNARLCLDPTVKHLLRLK